MKEGLNLAESHPCESVKSFPFQSHREMHRADIKVQNSFSFGSVPFTLIGYYLLIGSLLNIEDRKTNKKKKDTTSECHISILSCLYLFQERLMFLICFKYVFFLSVLQNQPQ